jgi:DMSO/TMAO reductase YedYZ molybdopterin-dependent catalytic subunit
MRFPSTQWLNDRVPLLDSDSFQVRVLDGDYTSRELAAFGDSIKATLDCTGGWFTTQNWQGASLDRFIKDGVGRSIMVRSVTGYWRRFPIDEAERLLLATHIAGEPLTRGHGSPVRLVAPGRRGFWWVKWVDTVTIDEVPPWWQPPLPTA